jgi:hypothetical protein
MIILRHMEFLSHRTSLLSPLSSLSLYSLSLSLSLSLSARCIGGRDGSCAGGGGGKACPPGAVGREWKDGARRLGRITGIHGHYASSYSCVLLLYYWGAVLGSMVTCYK